MRPLGLCRPPGFSSGRPVLARILNSRSDTRCRTHVRSGDFGDFASGTLASAWLDRLFWHTGESTGWHFANIGHSVKTALVAGLLLALGGTGAAAQDAAPSTVP